MRKRVNSADICIHFNSIYNTYKSYQIISTKNIDGNNRDTKILCVHIWLHICVHLHMHTLFRKSCSLTPLIKYPTEIFFLHFLFFFVSVFYYSYFSISYINTTSSTSINNTLLWQFHSVCHNVHDILLLVSHLNEAQLSIKRQVWSPSVYLCKRNKKEY